MNINEMTIKQVSELMSVLSPATELNQQPYEIGKDYLVRTVTHIDIGTVVSVGEKEIVMKNVSWIADTGRWADALKDGTLSDVEPFPEGELVILGRGAVIDAVRWMHSLPRTQK